MGYIIILSLAGQLLINNRGTVEQEDVHPYLYVRENARMEERLNKRMFTHTYMCGKTHAWRKI